MNEKNLNNARKSARPVWEEGETEGDVPPLSLSPGGSEPQTELLHQTLQQLVLLNQADDVLHNSPEVLLLHTYKPRGIISHLNTFKPFSESLSLDTMSGITLYRVLPRREIIK